MSQKSYGLLHSVYKHRYNTYIYTYQHMRLRKSRRNGKRETVAESDKTKHAGLICENIKNPIWKTNNKL